MNKISNRGIKALGAGLVSLSVAGFGSLLMLAPGANAADGDGSASISATVTSQEICGWNLLGAPADFTLAPLVNGTEYDGAALELLADFTDSDTSTLNLYVSGTDQNPRSRETTTACTWYASSGVSPAAATVQMAFTGSFASAATKAGVAVFDAGDQEDASLSFTPGQNIGLRGGVTAANMLITPVANDATACEAVVDGKKFAVEDVSLSTAAAPETIMTMLIANVAGTADINAGQRCDLGFQVKVTVPEQQLPYNPGAIYTWSGVTLLTTITTSVTD
jgi:hypothetical protein